MFDQRRSDVSDERLGTRNRFMDRGRSDAPTDSAQQRHSNDYWPLDDDVQERQAVNFDPNADLQQDSVRES